MTQDEANNAQSVDYYVLIRFPGSAYVDVCCHWSNFPPTFFPHGMSVSGTDYVSKHVMNHTPPTVPTAERFSLKG